MCCFKKETRCKNSCFTEMNEQKEQMKKSRKVTDSPFSILFLKELARWKDQQSKSQVLYEKEEQVESVVRSNELRNNDAKLIKLETHTEKCAEKLWMKKTEKSRVIQLFPLTDVCASFFPPFLTSGCQNVANLSDFSIMSRCFVDGATKYPLKFDIRMSKCRHFCARALFKTDSW